MRIEWCDIATLKLTKKFMNACAFECTSISFYPEVGLKVRLVPPLIDVARELTVSKVDERDGHFLVWFDEVTSKSSMQQFDGMHMLVMADVELEAVEAESFEGWTLINNGERYEIVDSIEMPTQILITLDCGVDLPLHDDFIVDVDESAQTIKTNFEDYFFEN